MKSWVVVAVSCLTAAYGQNGPSSDVPFAGCYEVVSLAWSPPDETIKFIPKRFQLFYETAQPARTILSVRAVPFSLSDPFDKLWTWKPKGNELWISWGTGFGGFRGTLKPSSGGELVGKLKEWCDARCGWKKRVGKIRVRKIDCTKGQAASLPDNWR